MVNRDPGLGPTILRMDNSYSKLGVPLKESFKGDIDTGIGVDIDSDMAVSINWGVL